VEYACQALRAGKSVWLEKPAAINEAGLATLLSVAREASGFLMVGFNRRFSPHARFAESRFANRSSPLRIYYRISAGPMPAGTWLTDPVQGGGRIVGEVCHFVDLCNYLTGGLAETVHSDILGNPETDDSMTATLRYPDGSIATIDYLGSAASGLPKEFIEMSAGGTTVQIDNFRNSRVIGGGRKRSINQDKGQLHAVRAAVAACHDESSSPIDLASIANVTRTTFAIIESARLGQRVAIDSSV
jgi:polar amino acid transport system substrate-binding protein